MYEVDRIIAIIKPTQKMLEFLRQQPNQNQELTLEDIRSDCTALLIPLFTTPGEAEDYIEDIYQEVFQNELFSWGIDEHAWPELLTLELFQAWFEVEFHSIVYDLGETNEDEEPEEDEDEVSVKTPLQ